jgi:CBS domain-containing protein
MLEMRVKEICTRDVRSCAPDTNLADVAWAMWEGDCGVLPILDASGKVTGVITDRDISMAVATKYRPAREIAAHEVTTGKVFSCTLNDDVRDALKIMRSEKVRRLPVVDAQGKLQGILSLKPEASCRSSPRGESRIDRDVISRPTQRSPAFGQAPRGVQARTEVSARMPTEAGPPRISG